MTMNEVNKNNLMLEVKNLKKSFGNREILKGISFSIKAGETVGIIGPSGCGKSTILKLLCNLIEPDGGEIIKYSNDISLVFQGSALLNSLTVKENLSLALRNKHLSKREEAEIIAEKLKLVGLSNFANSYPAQLSGGQQKRTSFARAIVIDPKIIFYDEPTTGLDPILSTIIEDYIITLSDQLRAAAIVVTHQLSTWTRTTDRLILLHAGEIKWQGKPQEALETADPYMRQFALSSRDGPILVG